MKTKANFRRNSRRSQLVRLILLTVFAVFVLYFFVGFVGKISSVITMPIYGVRSWIAHSSAVLPSYIRSRNELIDEIDGLREELSAQGGKDATITRMTAENEVLRSLLSIYDANRIVAAVSARPPFLPYDAVLIDRGRADGIADGAIVYHAGDQTIGFISKAEEHSALVTLFSTPGVTATAYVVGPNIYTTAYGEGGGVVRISVPQGVQIAPGNVVILPSTEVGILGTIHAIESSPTQPVQHGYVISHAPIQSLHLVSVSSRVPDAMSYEEAEEVIAAYEAQFQIEVPEEALVEGAQATSTASGTLQTVAPEALPE